MHRIKHVGPFNSLECNLFIDTLSLVHLSVSSADLYGILVESMCRNIKLVERCFETRLEKSERSMKLSVPVHFNPPGFGHLLTVVYPSGSTDKERSKICSISFNMYTRE